MASKAARTRGSLLLCDFFSAARQLEHEFLVISEGLMFSGGRAGTDATVFFVETNCRREFPKLVAKKKISRRRKSEDRFYFFNFTRRHSGGHFSALTPAHVFLSPLSLKYNGARRLPDAVMVRPGLLLPPQDAPRRAAPGPALCGERICGSGVDERRLPKPPSAVVVGRCPELPC